MAGIRCAMSLNQSADATYFLTWLNREFPRDAAVLYLSTHVYSDLATRASQELLFTAPASPEVHELNAEALEMQGKWQDALAEYRAVLEKDPRMAGHPLPHRPSVAVAAGNAGGQGRSAQGIRSGIGDRPW